MNGRWNWLWRFALVIVVVLFVAGFLGSMGLFKTTVAVPGKLTAANIVKFLAYGAALAIFFLAAQRAASQLRTERNRAAFLGEVLIPLATFVIAASAHGVLLLVLKLFVSGELRTLYNWIFVAATLAAAAWLVLSILQQSVPLEELASNARKRVAAALKDDAAQEVMLCTCGAANSARAKFCDQCGKAA